PLRWGPVGAGLRALRFALIRALRPTPPVPESADMVLAPPPAWGLLAYVPRCLVTCLACRDWFRRNGTWFTFGQCTDLLRGNCPCAGAITDQLLGAFMWGCSHPLNGPDAEPRGRRVPCRAGEHRRPEHRSRGEQ